MKSLPPNPDIEFLKKEAKALRALHKQGAISCCQRIRQHDTCFQNKTDQQILSTRLSINDFQRVVAREYGFAGWAALKKYVQHLGGLDANTVSDKQAYHKTITDSYDERAPVYDNHVWAREQSIQLVDYCPPKKNHRVLDIATGSGTIAFYVADMVGEGGTVVGIDISTGMLRRCNEKLRQSKHKQVSFMYADGEKTGLSANQFDRLYASSALYWMINPLSALRHWYELLAPGGCLGFTAWPDNLFVWGNGARQALRKQGVEFTVHEFTGTPEKTRELMTLAGFSNIRLHVVKDGHYIPAHEINGPLLTLQSYAPGQYPHPLTGVPEQTIALAQRDYEAEVERLTTDKGVWFDRTMYYVFGEKR